MQRIRQLIEAKEAAFAAHPFFARLARNAPFEDTRRFAPQLTFWVFTFQDVLRLNESRVVDPTLRALVSQHAKEDSGHEHWFLNDVTGIDGAIPSLSWLFSPDHAATRDAGYAMMSEVFRATYDAERIALLLALESAAHAFFPQVSSYLQRQGRAEGLRYFSGMHLDAEAGHELFEEEMDAVVNALALDDAQYEATQALVERIFGAFTSMFDSIEAGLDTDALSQATAIAANSAVAAQLSHNRS